MHELDAAAATLSSDLEALIAKRRTVGAAPVSQPQKLPARIYGIMAVTMVLTFATLTTGYQVFFPPHQLFA